MCRWIAYQGSPLPLEHYVTEPKHSLISQSLHALEGSASMNGDGFGLGWYGDYPNPGLYHEVRPAWSDENLTHLCRHIRSRLFFAHVRAATATTVMRANCHPFASRQWLFMHNGFVGNWHGLRRRIEELISDELYPERQGTTDSEAIFLAIMGADVEADPVAATSRVMQELKKLILKAGNNDKLRFTAALSDGHRVYAFRYAINDEANTLYYRRDGLGTVIASEPLDENRGSWTLVQPDRVLVAEPEKIPQVLKFTP